MSPEFDQAILASTVGELRKRGLPVAGTHPIYSAPMSALGRLDPLPAPGKECPQGQGADAQSYLGGRQVVRCVPSGQAFSPSFIVPWALLGDPLIMDGKAMRASGFPWAEKAAQVLDSGGAVVHDATSVGDDGTVRLSNGAVVSGIAVPDLGATMVVSPHTAAALGLTGPDAPVYTGVMVELTRPLSADEEDRVKQVVLGHNSLVTPGTRYELSLWGGPVEKVTLGALGLLALVTLAVALVLARTQQRREQATMHAVGASPRFLRAVTAAQAAVMLMVALPLGTAVGWGTSAYLVAWNRYTAAMWWPWLRTEGLWGWQVLGLAVFSAVGLALAWALGRPARELVRRRMD